MGEPKNSRKLWRRPKRPLNYELLGEELQTVGKFGLKNKRELWKTRTEISRIRHQARSLLALPQEEREKKEAVLLKSLNRIGLVNRDSTLDNVLGLTVTDLLSRRLQSIIQKKGNFKTPYQARQAVVHGHVSIGDRVVDIPSYLVTVEEEEDIRISPSLLEQISKHRIEQEEPVEEQEATKDDESEEQTQ